MSPTVSRRVLLKNALANVASGTSAALLAVVLPPILLKYLSRDIYAVWALILQVGAYTGLLNFGIQVAVGRFVAHYETTGETERRDALVSTAWVSLMLAGAVAALGMVAVAFAFPHLFPKIPPQLQGQARLAMAWVGLSMAVGLPFSAFMGVFIGKQRHEVPGLIQMGSRLLTGVALVWIAIHGGTLVSMAEAFAGINLLTFGVQFAAYHLWAGTCHIHIRQATIRETKTLWNYCFSLSVMSIAMLMVSGLDLVIVGRVDFDAVPAYAIATGLVAFMAGLQNAVFNVLIPAGAVLGAAADASGLQRMLLNSTRYGVLLLLASSLPLMLGGHFFLLHYVGPGLTAPTLPLLRLLVVGNFIRLVAAPYSFLLVATGQQQIALVSPIVEGVSNLAISIFLGIHLGAAGVGIGTVVGAILGVLCHLFYSFPKTPLLSLTPWNYVINGIITPLLAGIPWVFWWYFSHKSALLTISMIYYSVLPCMISLFVVYRVVDKEGKAIRRIKKVINLLPD
jgi:O-antigen/teichoic acid export membrane protein